MKIKKVAGMVATGIPDHILERRKQVGTLLGNLHREKEQLDAQITMAMGAATQGISPKGHRVVIQSVHRGSYTVQETQYTKTNIYLAK